MPIRHLITRKRHSHRTTLKAGYFVQKFLSPSGDDIYKCISVNEWLPKLDLTRLMKIILSSETPCSMRTSTAFIADPPVAADFSVLSYSTVIGYVPSIGSNRRTYLDAMSSGNYWMGLKLYLLNIVDVGDLPWSKTILVAQFLHPW